MNIMNKKGGEKILSIWWFACLVLVGVAVTTVLMAHFGATVDTRRDDAMMLQEKILDCITDKGYIRTEILSMGNTELMKFCKLNEQQFQDTSPFLFNLTVYDHEEKVNLSMIAGQISYQEDCLAMAGKRAKNYPVCIQTKEHINYFEPNSLKKESWKIYLLVASNNHGFKTPIVKVGTTNEN